MLSTPLLLSTIGVQLATGAVIDESIVKTTLRVPSARYATLRSAFEAAHDNLSRGVPTRIQIAPGIYRESITGMNWREGRAADTLLIVEGKGKVVWTGADVFPRNEWKEEGDLWIHPWPHQWGNFGYSWSAKGLVGHRSEMAFLNDKPLIPRIVEQYEIAGIVQDPARPGEISYRYLGRRDPKELLRPGEFGITERDENGTWIYLRPPTGAKVGPTSIEVSVRRNLLDLRGKNRVVLRNIEFTKVANDDGDFGANNAVRFSIADGQRSHDVLIDQCKILWSAQTGLHIDGERWTIRDSDFSYNGGSGIASGRSTDVLWERNRTDFNVWRLWRAGEMGYYTGGFKMHETKGHTIRGHEAIGNCTMGAWWDIHCRDVSVRDLVAVDNAANLQFELCEGPFVAERLLLAGGLAGDGQIRLWEHGATVLRDSILYSNYRGSGTTGLYNLRWFGRTDDHAKLAKLTAGTNVAENNVFVAGPNVPNFGMIDDIRGSEWSRREPLVYAGTNNVFWNPTLPNFHERWIKDNDRKGELAARATPVAEWMRAPTYSETNPQRLDPNLRDPEKGDFRFKRESPLYTTRQRWPQVVLSPKLRKEMAEFYAWSGYNPNRWSAPPAE